MAQRLGDKKLGEEPAPGSQSQLGIFNIQKVQDKLYWVAPLEHRSSIIKGTDLRFSTDVKNGSSFYNMVISGAENKIFI